MIVTLTQDHIDYLRGSKIFLNPKGQFEKTWLKVGSRYDTIGTVLIEPYSACYVGPRLTSIGAFGYTKSYFPAGSTRIGRYCAIAEGAGVMQGDHPVDRLSMCGFDYAGIAPFAQYEADRSLAQPKLPPQLAQGQLIIGNDVWIGQGALFKRGIRIGHGAIIAAGSVVTRDVEPYALVAGAPARVKKFRFSDREIRRLLASRWWDYAYDQFRGMDTRDPSKFLPNFGAAKEQGRVTPLPEQFEDIHVRFREISASQS